MQRVPDFAPWHQHTIALAPLARGHVPEIAGVVHGQIADEIGQVRHDPVLGGLDEPVVVQLAQIVLDDVDLLAYHSEQSAQRIALLRIAQPMHARKQLVQPIVLARHGVVQSVKVSVAGRRGLSRAN
jgi:hypothetical protein